MKVSVVIVNAAALLGLCQGVFAASSWTFTDATVSVQGKGSGVGSGSKEKYDCTFSHILPILTVQTRS